MRFAREVGFSLVLGLFATALATSASAQASEERARAERLIRELESNGEQRALSEPLVARSRTALLRAQSARQAGDQTHGAALEALALELAETARDLARAVKAERELGKLEARAADTETRAVRAQALVEQTAARRGRAAEELEALQAEKARGSETRVSGSRKPPQPKPAPLKAGPGAKP